MKKILIANRGEIALRVLRACKELGIKTVAAHSEPDASLKHVKLADESVCIGPASPTDSYLNIPAIISAAEITHTDGIHPGYGFLSEKADFAKQVKQSGFCFIGPDESIIEKMGDKVAAIETMKKLGVPTVPGSDGPLSDCLATNKKIAASIGYPIIIKAAGGGGGRGMRIVNKPEELENSIKLTKTESMAAFGDDTIYMEKYLTNPRHIEFQIISDQHGNCISISERDCSLQRRHQKVIEEAPAIGIPESLKNKIAERCRNACVEMGYVGAGTFEFLYQEQNFYFIEMNTRIQVEHPVSEEISGLDLIKEQISVAAGNELSIKQEDINIYGHSIECRINAEDPENFRPSPGLIKLYHPPGGRGVRVDSHIYSGYEVTPFYDSMIAKVITFGSDRRSAITRMIRALDELVIEGITTNKDMHKKILESELFNQGEYTIQALNQIL